MLCHGLLSFSFKLSLLCLLCGTEGRRYLCRLLYCLGLLRGSYRRSVGSLRPSALKATLGLTVHIFAALCKGIVGSCSVRLTVTLISTLIAALLTLGSVALIAALLTLGSIALIAALLTLGSVALIATLLTLRSIALIATLLTLGSITLIATLLTLGSIALIATLGLRSVISDLGSCFGLNLGLNLRLCLGLNLRLCLGLNLRLCLGLNLRLCLGLSFGSFLHDMQRHLAVKIRIHIFYFVRGGHMLHKYLEFLIGNRDRA